MTTERCAAADRCVDYDRREKLAAEAVDGPLCEGEMLAGERAVQALVWTYGDLEQLQLPSLGNRGDGQPGASDEHRTPLNLAAEALQAEIHRVLTTWEDVAREREKLSESVTKHVRAGWAVQAAAQILRPRIRLLARVGPVTLVDYPEVEDDQAYRLGSLVYSDVPGWKGVLDFARLHRRAQHQLGLTAVKPELCDGVPCRECDMKTLYRVPGSSEVECLSCRLRLDGAAYKRWLGIVAAHVQRAELEEFEKVPGDR